MPDEKTISPIEASPELGQTGSWFADTLICGRESLLNRLAGATPSLVINQASGATTPPMSPSNDLAAKLKQALDDLKRSVMSEDGARIDYAALRASQTYAAYQEECLVALRHFNPESLLTTKARRAFWINLYNALVIDAVINLGIHRSVIQGRLGILTFFRRAAYQLGDQRVSLEDIEHGILRGNRGNPYLPGPHFATNDPRLAWVVPLDPRLHFALNCGGRSCPPIRAYSAGKLDAQLDLAARGFITATVGVRPEQNQVLLSPILKWYAKDFGSRQGILDFLLYYLPADDRRAYLSQARETVRFRYTTHDWALNNA